MKLTILSLTVAISSEKGRKCKDEEENHLFSFLFKINDKGASAMEEMVVVTPEKLEKLMKQKLEVLVYILNMPKKLLDI